MNTILLSSKILAILAGSALIVLVIIRIITYRNLVPFLRVTEALWRLGLAYLPWWFSPFQIENLYGWKVTLEIAKALISVGFLFWTYVYLRGALLDNLGRKPSKKKDSEKGPADKAASEKAVPPDDADKEEPSKQPEESDSGLCH